jgi:RNA polymerase sigma-70 factor (ECF subfamily)
VGEQRPSATTSHKVTKLLVAWGDGDERALEQLTPMVYQELRRMARRYMTGERAGHTLDATALVHEAYLKLVDVNRIRWQNRAHFFAMSARLMRRILVDIARTRGSHKRGADAHRITYTEALSVMVDRGHDLVAVDEALEELATLDPRKARVVEFRFFGGLTVDETAEALQVSPQTVMRDWKLAKAWLLKQLATVPAKSPR